MGFAYCNGPYYDRSGNTTDGSSLTLDSSGVNAANLSP